MTTPTNPASPSRMGRTRAALLIPALALACVAAIGTSRPPDQGRSAPKRELKVLHLSGTARERGVQHGTQLRSEIAAIVGLWKQDLRKSTGTDADVLIKAFLGQTDFTPAIKKWTPDLLDEVRGIADGAEQPYETMFAFQLVDELWVFADKGGAEHCTSLGVARSGTHPAYVAQNMDLETFRDGFQAVLHIAASASAPEQFVFTSAGLIGLNGVNSRSIAITCNTLLELAASHDGLPVAFIVRGVLAKAAAEDAVAFLKGVKHASGQNYIVGTGDRVFDFEASAGKVVEFRPSDDGRVVFHTNHPVANDDLKPWHRAMRQLMSPAQWASSNSPTRFASIEKRLQRPPAAIDEDAIKAALRSQDSARHPICRSLAAGAASYTFGATIMTLSGRPSLQVTMGPPDVNAFVRLEFSGAAVSR